MISLLPLDVGFDLRAHHTPVSLHDEVGEVAYLDKDGKEAVAAGSREEIAQSTVSDYLSSIDHPVSKKPISNGKKSDQSRTKKANLARIEYCSEKRIELIDRGMAHLEAMLSGRAYGPGSRGEGHCRPPGSNRAAPPGRQRERADLGRRPQ